MVVMKSYTSECLEKRALVHLNRVLVVLLLQVVATDYNYRAVRRRGSPATAPSSCLVKRHHANTTISENGSTLSGVKQAPCCSLNRQQEVVVSMDEPPSLP
jgi:hypothetical protein